jgi:hypothetical protein
MIYSDGRGFSPLKRFLLKSRLNPPIIRCEPSDGPLFIVGWFPLLYAWGAVFALGGFDY